MTKKTPRKRKTVSKIEMVEIALLKPNPKNAKIHSPKQIDQIVKSIREFGYTNPILIEERNMILAGHGRAMALEKMGVLKAECKRITGLTRAQKNAYLLADNKLADNGDWDYEMLAEELKALNDIGFDLDTIGFDEVEIENVSKHNRIKSTKKIDTDDMGKFHTCPKCGFEFQKSNA